MARSPSDVFSTATYLSAGAYAAGADAAGADAIGPAGFDAGGSAKARAHTAAKITMQAFMEHLPDVHGSAATANPLPVMLPCRETISSPCERVREGGVELSGSP